ncbi:hypothetical protein AB0O34_15910 [Sphaerisporangium sp. NPDC088356]|uniref:hypothetical protein n=1 Tax=Sphaerisporangium sp. NPDC088356 TaxID=3154871 RepID=UPI003440FD5E
MSSQADYDNGDIAALVIAALYTISCLLLAWLEHRAGQRDGLRGSQRDEHGDGRAGWIP